MRNSGGMLLAAALLLMVPGCGMRDVQEQSPDSGETQTFDAPYAAVAQAAAHGITRMRLDITHETEEPDRLVILFVRPTSSLQWGAAGRLVVDKSAASPTAVHISYETRLPLSGGGQERWARAIFARMTEELGAAGTAKRSP